MGSTQSVAFTVYSLQWHLTLVHTSPVRVQSGILGIFPVPIPSLSLFHPSLHRLTSQNLNLPEQLARWQQTNIVKTIKTYYVQQLQTGIVIVMVDRESSVHFRVNQVKHKLRVCMHVPVRMIFMNVTTITIPDVVFASPPPSPPPSPQLTTDNWMINRFSS